MRAGHWSHTPLRALRECTLGIVGFGNIGTAVARRAAAFRMRILACDVRPLDQDAAEATWASRWRRSTRCWPRAIS